MDTGTTVAISTAQAWRRCLLTDLAVDTDLPGYDDANTAGVLPEQEHPEAQTVPGWIGPPDLSAVGVAGLAFGSDCRVYRSAPEKELVTRAPWTPGTRSRPIEEVLFGPTAAGPAGDFGPVLGSIVESGSSSGGVRARAVAVSTDGHLALIDEGDGSLLTVDLPGRTPVSRHRLRARGLDVASVPRGLVILIDDADQPLEYLGFGSSPRPVPVGRPTELPAKARPVRIAATTDGIPWILWQDSTLSADGKPVSTGYAATAGGPVADRIVLPGIAGADDLELDGRSAVVLSGPGGADFVRFGPDRPPVAGRLRAPGYDGRGIARTADGRIGYHGAAGFRIAFGNSAGRLRSGHLITPALDGAVHGRRWGRVFVDACLPAETSLRISALTSEVVEPEDIEPDDAGGLSPSEAVAERFHVDAGDGSPTAGAVFRRGDSDEPWATGLRRVTDPAFGDLTGAANPVTFETMVDAPPGRYLWLRLDLTGESAAVPRVLALRVEKPAPHLLERLPAVFAAEPSSAAFLDRYLMLLAGNMSDLDRSASQRHVLFDPASAPDELLPWLASLVGLVLDNRWPVASRRRLIERAVPLFRARGTIGALTEMMRILIGIDPIIVEQYRYRNVGDADRVGAGYQADAHRFTVVILGSLSVERESALRDLLEVHRPAHTIVTVCSAGSSGIGRGLHLGLTSVVNGESSMPQFTVGGVIGTPMVLGTGGTGLAIGRGSIGQGFRVTT